MKSNYILQILKYIDLYFTESKNNDELTFFELGFVLRKHFLCTLLDNYILSRYIMERYCLDYESESTVTAKLICDEIANFNHDEVNKFIKNTKLKNII